MAFTVEYNDERCHWVVVRWEAASSTGTRSGTEIERCVTESHAQEITEAYNTAMV